MPGGQIMALHTFKINFRDSRSDTGDSGHGYVHTTVEYIETSVSNAMNRLYREFGASDGDLCQIVMVRNKKAQMRAEQWEDKSLWSGD
jgi:hypothetical protein